jgi:hypothetical protein
MGLIPGLRFHKYYPGKYTEGWNLFRLSLYALVATFLGTLVPSILSISSDQLGLFFPILFYSIPMFFMAAFNGVLIAPLITRGLEFLDSKNISIAAGKSTSSALKLDQISILSISSCFLLSFGFFILNYVLNTGNVIMGCGAGAPFSHEIAGDISIALDLGIYIFLGLGLALSIAVLLRGIYAKTKATELSTGTTIHEI